MGGNRWLSSRRGRRADATPTGTGPARALVALYGVFALAAGARAAVQLSTRFSEAPLAYLLSAFAAVVYVVATIGLVARRPGRPAPRADRDHASS